MKQGTPLSRASYGDGTTCPVEPYVLIILSAPEVSYRNLSHTFQIKNRGHQPSAVVIESLLPNPDGSDRFNEEVTLRNDTVSVVSMEGWILEDESGRIRALVSLGNIDPGQSMTIRRNGMPMSLNNTGDEISIFNASHELVDRFSYPGSQQGVRIQTGH